MSGAVSGTLSARKAARTCWSEYGTVCASNVRRDGFLMRAFDANERRIKLSGCSAVTTV